jgi:hypothetical protein
MFWNYPLYGIPRKYEWGEQKYSKELGEYFSADSTEENGFLLYENGLLPGLSEMVR